MNTFEDSLRDKLGQAVPDVPDDHRRADGARTYAGRARRNRVAALAGAGAAVVIAAVAVIPNVVGAGDDAPVATGPAETRVQQLPDPFTCPKGDQDTATLAPADGKVPAGAVLARVCATDTEDVPWKPPRDALTTDVDAVADAVNALPKLPVRSMCTMELGPAYLLTFQYPDGDLVTVKGENYGCQRVSVGASDRRGAAQILNLFTNRLQQQRQGG